MRKSWKEEELAILKRTYPIGGKRFAFQALKIAGYNRTEKSGSRQSKGFENQIFQQRPV